MTWEESPEEKLARFGVHQLPKGGGNGAGLHRLPFHPLADHFPMMDRASPEFRGLVASIKQVGLTEPITLFEGKVLDGRNRLLACEEAGVEPRFEVFDAAEQTPLSFVLSKNLYRRHLTEGQKALKAEEMVTSKHGGDRRSDSKRPNGPLIGEPVTIDKAAALWCVSPRAVKRAAFVRAHTETTPKILAEVTAGHMSLGRAAVLAKLTDEEQRAAPDVKFAGSKPKPMPAVRPVTVPALQALTDAQAAIVAAKLMPRVPDRELVDIVDKLLPRLNRIHERQGKRLAYVTLTEG
jgi:ParB-like nuclease domain